MEDSVRMLLEKVVMLQKSSKIEKINKGFSPNEKFICYNNGQNLLVRVGYISGYKKKKQEFQILNKMKELNVKIPKPVEIGVIQELGSYYAIYTYIDGDDGKVAIGKLTEDEQYELGTEAGQQLARLHQYEAPLNVGSWYENSMNKHYRYLEAYTKCGIKINNDERIIDFIEENKYLLKSRPNRFQHDDFHLENIIVKDKKFAGVIDFDNFDWGDPLHDFVKVALFQREISVPFSIGQIEGYFNHTVPEHFWKLYSIYVAMVIFSSVVWSLRFAPEEIDGMLERIQTIMNDHQNFEALKPEWFK